MTMTEFGSIASASHRVFGRCRRVLQPDSLKASRYSKCTIVNLVDVLKVSRTSEVYMEFWQLNPSSSAHPLAIGQVAKALSRIGSAYTEPLAGELLRMLEPHVRIAQCTVFAYEGTHDPQIVSFADRARTRHLPDIARTYAACFHRLDGNQAAMASGAAHGDEKVLVQRQSVTDIAHTDYRRICYEQPHISERVALLSFFDGWRWLSINFYSGREHGTFSGQEIEVIESYAPLIVQIVRLQYNYHVSSNELPALLAMRLTRSFPELTRRDGELLRAMLDGLSITEIAERIGVKPTSAQTYVKRIYGKLGVSSLRELMGLVLKTSHVFPLRG